MSAQANAILAHLNVVEKSRDAVRADPPLQRRVHAVKSYQGQRFERTYRDWIEQPASNRACRFFLDELYGAKDFSERDRQFARIVPTMTRMFPTELTDTVKSLAALHALSESLDLEMARNLQGPNVDAVRYTAAWQATGRSPEREQQIQLMQDVGNALSVYTRKPMLRRGLRLMRAAAEAAGLGDLQRFLEDGFDSFASLPDAKRFLSSVASRERALAARLFEADADELAGSRTPDNGDPLGELP